MWYIIIFAILFLVGLIVFIVYGIPALAQINRDALAPVRDLVGNPESAASLAMLL
jgi:hypothetical protein